MINILFISHTGGRGGAETVLLDAIKTIACDKEKRIFIAIPNDNNDAFVDGLGDVLKQCRIERFSFRPIRNTMLMLVRNLVYGILLGLPKLAKFIKENKIDVVYVNSSVNVIGVMAARKAGCRYVWHIHEQSTRAHRWAPKWCNLFYQKWLLDKSCKSIFVSNTSYKLWLNDLEVDMVSNSKIIYSPYKQIATITKTNRPFTFGYIGSLSDNKNVERLIEAFELLPDVQKLIIGGSGESEVNLKKRAKENCNIKFLGHIDDLDSFYSSIDCLVVPSLNESWGLVALEAISAGVPVIMTKNTGLVELFDNAQECIFVEPTSVEDIVKAMKEISQNPTYAKTLAANAKTKLETLDINNKFSAQLLSVINE